VGEGNMDVLGEVVNNGAIGIQGRRLTQTGVTHIELPRFFCASWGRNRAQNEALAACGD